MRERGVKENGHGKRCARRRGLGSDGARPIAALDRRGQHLHQEEAILLQRDIRWPFPGCQGQAIRHPALGIAEHGELEGCGVAEFKTHDEIAIEFHIRALERDAIGGGFEGQAIRGGLVNGAAKPHPDAEGACDQRLAIHGGKSHAELAGETDDLDLLLKLQLESLGGLGGDGRHLYRERSGP